jgi:hypothetical protein
MDKTTNMPSQQRFPRAEQRADVDGYLRMPRADVISVGADWGPSSEEKIGPTRPSRAASLSDAWCHRFAAATMPKNRAFAQNRYNQRHADYVLIAANPALCDAKNADNSVT